MVSNEINVGIGEIKVADNYEVINCLALGSCVAIILYEPKLKVGAIAHVMLPESNGTKKAKNSAKYADRAIKEMIRALKRRGAEKQKLIAKVVGGAHMFKVNDSFVNNVGSRNVMAARTILNYEGIKIISEDTGGDYGRSVKFYTTDGSLKICSKKGEKEI